MAIYYTSPAERRAQAEARIQSREYNRQYEEYQAQLKAEEEAQEIAARKRAEEDAFTRTWQTLGDGLSDIAYGFFGFGEGLVDLVAGGVGAIGGIFDSGFQDDVKDFIANDWVAQFIRDPADELFQASFIHDDQSGIAEGVLNGVGQMLPMVLITMATFGAGAAPSAAAAGGSAAGTAAAGATSAASAAQAAAAAAKTAEILNLSLLGASAAGKGAEEAYNDGAGYYQGLGYGAASGLIEVGTEKMTGGVGAMKNMFEKGVFDGVKRSVADVGLKKFAKEAIGEGLEEVASDALNPFAKAIYKGTDAIKDAYIGFDNVVETGKGMLKSFTVGTLTSAAVGNLSNAAIKKTKLGDVVEVGRGADVEASLSSVQYNFDEMTRIDSRGTLTAEKEIKFQDNIEKNYRQVEEALKKTNEKNRARLIEKFGLSEMFDKATGQMTDAFSEQLSAQRSMIGKTPLYGNMTVNMRDQVPKIISDVAEIEEVWNKPTDVNPNGNQDSFTVTETPLTEDGQKNFNDLKKFAYERMGGNIGLVVVDSTTADFHAAKSTDGSAIYVNRADVESETGIDRIKSMVHETYHVSEGTDSSVSLFTEMKNDPALYESARDEIVNNGYATAEDVDAYLTARESGNNGSIEGLSDETVSLIESELGAAMAEKTFGNEAFFKKAIRDNVTFAQKILNHISDRAEYYAHSSTKESRDAYKRYLKMEKLYIKAAEEAGYRYENGRLIGRSGETDDGDEVLDKSGEVRYSKNKDRLIGMTFPPYNKSGSEANELATRWAHREDVKAGWQSLISYHDRWYLIEKFDDSDLGYQIVERLSKKEYERYTGWKNGRNAVQRSIQKSTAGIGSLDRRGNRTVGRERGSDSVETRHARENQQIQSMGSIETSQRQTSSDGNGDRRSGGGGEQGSDLKFRKTSSTTENDRTYLEAVKNGDMETAEKMVREAAEKAGYTRLFYHGSKNGGGFTVFRDWQYFTENRKYAERYAERENSDSLYTTYVKMDNPFDTRIESVRKLFEQARQEYGMGELQENGLPDWTDGYDIADYIEENGFPFDSILLDEGGDLLDGKPVSRGLSYVIRNSNQIKSAETVTYDESGNVIPLSERFNKKNSDIRFRKTSSEGKDVVLDSNQTREYNTQKGVNTYERTDEFVRLQEESRRMSDSELQSYRSGSKVISSEKLKRLSVVFAKEIERANRGGVLKQQSLVNPKTHSEIQFFENIDGRVFHDIFEISRSYLQNSELVDLHDDYSDARCFLSSDGLCGFAIEQDGNLVSVYNLGEKGFLDTIREYVVEKGATHLDGYNSPRQPLQYIYERKLGFKTASIMDYNMEYDHDNIAENHGSPQVAFMVNTDAEVTTRHFSKDQYDEAVAYQKSFIEKGIRFRKTNGENGTSDGQVKDVNDRIRKTVRRVQQGSPDKVYQKKEAKAVIDSVIADTLVFENGNLFGNIKGKSRAEIINLLWEGLNTSNADTRASVAMDVAEYLIQNSVVEEVVNDDANEYSRHIIASVKPYLRRMNLDSIREDVNRILGKDAARSFFSRWSAKKGTGIGVDVIVNDLRSESGIEIGNANDDLASVAIEIDRKYQEAMDSLKREAETSLEDGLSDEEYEALKKKIVDDLLDGFDRNGTKSEFSKYMDYYKSEIERYKVRIQEQSEFNKEVNRLLDKTQKIKDWKSGTFMNASVLKPDTFKGSIEKLAAIKNRGNVNRSGTRRIVGEVRDWYVANKDVLGKDYNEEIAQMLSDIADNIPNLTEKEQALFSKAMDLFTAAGKELTGFGDLASWYTKKNLGRQYDYDTKRLLSRIADMHELTLDDVRNLSKVMDYFRHFVENYQKVFRDGKRVDAKPIAEEYIRIAQENKHLKLGVSSTGIFAKYFKSFGDPMSVARFADKYEHGFVTSSMEELREGTFTASITEMNLRESLDEFHKKNKNWVKSAEKQKITYNGQEITKRQAIQIYMIMQREQLIPGAVLSGFQATDGKRTIRIDGLLVDDGNVRTEDVKKAAEAVVLELRSQFSDTDLQFISIAEEIYEKCRELKRERDLQRQGYSNVEEGYYVPGRRANVAYSIDTTYTDELSAVNNQSFNRNTVKGAKGELFLEPADLVLDRHINGIARYYGLSNALDNFDLIENLDVSGNPNKPVSVKTEIRDAFPDINGYFSNLINDISGVSKDRDGFNRVLGKIRSRYAVFQLGANLKVLLTQTSSLSAATSILDVTDILRGFTVKSTDVDEFCEVAKLRNYQKTAALAQGVLDQKSYAVTSGLDKLGDVLMSPIGMMDRRVVRWEFGACQVHVEKTEGLKIGTKENKIKAGELLKKVIIETQQNALQTERSAAMRSGNEIVRALTMFKSDAMKVTGRVLDAFFESVVLKARIKSATDENVRSELKSRRKSVNKRARKAISAQVGVALMMCAFAQMFRWLYNKDDDDENILANMSVDFLGNMLGGLPVIDDIYGKIMEGYDFDNYALSALNDLLESVNGIFSTVGKIASGEVETDDLGSSAKKMLYAVGQMTGVPIRNIYNTVYGVTKRVNPAAAYKIDTAFYNQNYRSDLKKAIESGDDGMVETIVGIMLDENVGGVSDSDTRNELNRLVVAGYDVLPDGVGNSFTYDGNTVQLTGSQKKQFLEVYSEAIPVVAKMMKSSYYQKATDEVREKAIKWIYSVYRNRAIDSLLDLGLDTKNELFSEVFDISDLAIIIATCNATESDKDKNGNVISGSRKKKIEAYVQSLRLSAAEKYMIMGYLGYKNKNGKQVVRTYIQRLGLKKEQKERLFEYCGYGEE